MGLKGWVERSKRRYTRYAQEILGINPDLDTLRFQDLDLYLDDNIKVRLGTGDGTETGYDAELYWDGTGLVLEGTTGNAWMPIPIGLFTEEDGTALTAFAPGATPGIQQLSNKEVVLAWDGNAAPTGVAVTVPLPMDLDSSADLVIHFLAKMAGATDTPVLVFECYINAGDTDCAGTDPEITGGTTLTEYTNTIAAANVAAPPGSLTIIMDPTDGEMGTDELHLYACWLEYTRNYFL